MKSLFNLSPQSNKLLIYLVKAVDLLFILIVGAYLFFNFISCEDGSWTQIIRNLFIYGSGAFRLSLLKNGTPAARVFVIASTIASDALSKILQNTINNPDYVKTHINSWKTIFDTNKPDSATITINDETSKNLSAALNNETDSTTSSSVIKQNLPDSSYLENLTTKLISSIMDTLRPILEPVASNYSNEVKALFFIKSWTSGTADGNNFLSEFTIDKLTAYLDTLTLLEESAFLHIAIFIFILCSIFNIFSALFGNEIIQYFKLEDKFPKLNIFFKYRAKFQKYYLAWNILSILFVCILAICLNLLVLY